MNILANALPGFRDLRAPIVAGYMWLLFAWILVDPNLKQRPSSYVGGAVYDLGHDVGRIAVAIAVSVGAYLLGSVSQVLASGVKRGYMSLLVNASPPPFGYRYTAIDPANSPPSEAELRQLADRASEAINRREAINRFEDSSRPSSGLPNTLDDRLNAAYTLSRTELGLPATLLVGKEPELFAEVDRLRSEGELRLAVVPPLLGLAVLLTSRMSWFWLLAIPLVIGLLDQGARKDADSRTLIGDAIARGLVKSPAVENFRLWVESVERDAAAPARGSDPLP